MRCGRVGGVFNTYTTSEDICQLHGNIGIKNMNRK